MEKWGTLYSLVWRNEELCILWYGEMRNYVFSGMEKLGTWYSLVWRNEELGILLYGEMRNSVFSGMRIGCRVWSHEDLLYLLLVHYLSIISREENIPSCCRGKITQLPPISWLHTFFVPSALNNSLEREIAQGLSSYFTLEYISLTRAKFSVRGYSEVKGFG